MEVNNKSVDDKKKEVSEIINEISKLKLNPLFDGIKKLYEICAKYIKTSESLSGDIDLEELDRRINYYLPQTRGIKAVVKLQYIG